MASETQGWIRLAGIRVEDASIGIHPHEHSARQLLIIDAALLVEMPRRDVIEETIDYTGAAEALIRATRARHYELIETLCEVLARTLLDGFPLAQRVHIEIKKPAALTNGLASVAVERSR
ncbi:MAG TPA: dihydroneopterin aldolase [Myxococcota bacterium]|nr:dihydroneopterin aldolase [Myxococcota bacterium]